MRERLTAGLHTYCRPVFYLVRCVQLWFLFVLKSMSEKLSQIFKKISEIEPPLGLERAILERIDLEKNKKLRLELVFSKMGICASLIGFLYVVFALGGALVSSEFASMLTLIFSDLTTVARNWNDYAFSLVETFPTLTIAIILIPLFIFFLLLSSYINLNNKKYHKHCSVV
jgi:hypothetical protein